MRLITVVFSLALPKINHFFWNYKKRKKRNENWNEKKKEGKSWWHVVIDNVVYQHKSIKESRIHYLLSYLTIFFTLEKENIHTVDGNYKFMYAINNQFPGPTVVVYENQMVSKCSVLNILILVSINLTIAMLKYGNWHDFFSFYISTSKWLDGRCHL